MNEVEMRSTRAMELFRQGYNCTQSVVLAFSDILGVDEQMLASLSCGLGGGVGRLREVCGTVSGMAIVAGAICDTRHKGEDADIRERKSRVYAIVQELAARFKADNGSIVCRELLGIRAQGHNNPQASERTSEYYSARPCEALVGYSAGIIAEYLAKNC